MGEREIFVAGDGSFSEYAQVFNLDTGDYRWGPVPGKPIHNSASVSRGPENGLAMLGGEVFAGHGLDEIHEYHCDTDQWTTMPGVMGKPRTELAAVDVTGLFECA